MNIFLVITFLSGLCLHLAHSTSHKSSYEVDSRFLRHKTSTEYKILRYIENYLSWNNHGQVSFDKNVELLQNIIDHVDRVGRGINDDIQFATLYEIGRHACRISVSDMINASQRCNPQSISYLRQLEDRT